MRRLWVVEVRHEIDGPWMIDLWNIRETRREARPLRALYASHLARVRQYVPKEK